MQKIAPKRALSPKNITIKILGPKNFFVKKLYGEKTLSSKNVGSNRVWVKK